MTTIKLVTNEQIRAAAVKLRNAVVKVKGEYELRYVPRDSNHPEHVLAGRSASDYPGHEYAVDDQGNYLGTEAHWAALEKQYSWIPDFYEHSAGPNPTGMQPLIDTLRSVSEKLYIAPTHQPGKTPKAIAPIESFIKATDTALADWKGHAAVAFRNNFQIKIPEAAQAQSYLAAALAHAVQGNRDLYLALRQDSLENATKAVTAVEQVPFCNPETVKAVVTVIGAAATVAAGLASIPVTGGATAAPAGVAAFTIIAGVSSGISAANLGKHKETGLNADTVDGVLLKAIDAVADLKKEVNNKEQEMVKALKETYNVVTGSARNLFLVPRPGALSMSDQDIKKETAYDGL